MRWNDYERLSYPPHMEHGFRTSAHRYRRTIMIRFRPVEHAITEDGEWVTVQEVPYDYHGRLLCDSCHTEVIIQEDASGNEIFVHDRRRRSERIQNHNCSYAVCSSRQPPATKTRRRQKQAPAGYTGFRGPLSTRTGNWHCTWCGYTFHGRKKCSRCNDWVYTVAR